MKALTDAELTPMLQQLPDWRLERGFLLRDWVFPDFAAALAFVNRVGELAEAEDHHPDIEIRYNKVRLALVTHDAHGITRRDVRLARWLDERFAATA